MEVREDEVEFPAQQIFDLFGEAHFEKSYDPGFASFDPHTFLVRALPPRGPRDAQGRTEVFAFIEYVKKQLQSLSEPQRLPFLLQETAWSHEIEHFHDCICTTAGFTAFLREWLFLVSASSGLQQMASDGWLATSRIVEMAGNDARAMDAFNYYTNLFFYRLVFNGDVPAARLSDNALNYDVVWGRYNLGPSLSFRIPFFPGQVSIDGERKCVAMPLGFRAMTEFRALTYQSYFIGSFGREYVNGLLELTLGRWEYTALNMMMTRVAKQHLVDFRQEWFGDAMFSIVGAALARDAGNGVDANPITSLIDLLKELDPEEIEGFTRHEQNLAHMREVAEGGLIDVLPIERNDWYGFHLREFAVRCFRDAIDALSKPSDPDVFSRDSLAWYSMHISDLPRPALSFQNGKVGVDRIRDESEISLALRVTSRWIVYRSVLEQALIAKELRCPVLKGPYRDFLHQDRPADYCKTGITQGGCGSCRHGDSLASHPECVWKTALTDFGLATR